MSNVKLDLSKFKHVSSDHKTTRLKHEDGHFLVLSHKNLGKDGQDQLAALAKGGMVKKEKRSEMSEQGKDVRHKEMGMAKDEAKGRAEMERHVKPNIKGLAEGGDVECGTCGTMNCMAHGGEVKPKYANEALAHQGREKIKAKHAMTPEAQAKNQAFWKEADKQLKNAGHGPLKKEFAEGGGVTPKSHNKDRQIEQGKKELKDLAEYRQRRDKKPSVWTHIIPKGQINYAEGGNVKDEMPSWSDTAKEMGSDVYNAVADAPRITEDMYHAMKGEPMEGPKPKMARGGDPEYMDMLLSGEENSDKVDVRHAVEQDDRNKTQEAERQASYKRSGMNAPDNRPRMAEGGAPQFGNANLKSQEEYDQQVHQPETAADGAQADYSYEADPGAQDHRGALKAAVYGAITDALTYGRQPAQKAMPKQAPPPEPQPVQSTPQPQMAPATEPTPQAPAPEQMPQQPAQAPQAQPMAAMDPNSPAQAGGENQMPTQMSTPEPQPVDLQEHLKQQYAQEDMAFQHDLNNGHITPKTYSNLMFDGKSTLGKIGSIFGVLMAGAGAGLLHQENAAFKLMDSIIQNDINAQVKSKDNAQNFVKMNQQRLMNQTARQVQQAGIPLTKEQKKALEINNLQSAATLSYMMTARSALKEQADKVAKMPEGALKQQAVQTLALMGTVADAKTADLAALAASKTALINNTMGNTGAPDQANADPEQAFRNQQRMLRVMGQDKIAEDNEARHLPASTGVVGSASRPLNDNDRNSITSGDAYDKQLARFADWTSKHSGALDLRDMKAGQAMAAELQGAYRMATHGGVYKEGEQNFISKLIDEDPTKFFNKIRVLPQLKALQQTNRAKMNDLVRGMGFKAYQPGAGVKADSSISPDQQKMIDLAKQNPNNPSAQKILKHFGIK